MMAAEHFQISRDDYRLWEESTFENRDLPRFEIINKLSPEKRPVFLKTERFYNFIAMVEPNKLLSRPLPNPFNYRAPTEEEISKLNGDDDDICSTSTTTTTTETQTTFYTSNDTFRQISDDMMNSYDCLFNNFNQLDEKSKIFLAGVSQGLKMKNSGYQLPSTAWSQTSHARLHPKDLMTDLQRLDIETKEAQLRFFKRRNDRNKNPRFWYQILNTSFFMSFIIRERMLK